MGIAAARPIFFHHSSNKLPLVTPRDPSDHPLQALKSMSQNYSPSFFNIRDSSFEPSNDEGLQHDQFQRAAQQIRCDKMRLRGFEPMVEIHQEEGEEGMLSEMFNFPVSGSGCSGGGTVELLLDHSAVPFPSVLPPPRPLPPPPNQFAFGGGGYNSEIGCSFIQSQGLSLSLSSSLQHLEAARASDGLLLFNGQGANISPVASFIPQNSHKPWFEIQRQDHRPAHVGYGSQPLVVNVLRTSKYFKAAKELLEEFCSVGRGHLKKAELRRSTNPSPQCLSSSSGKNNHSGDAGGGGVSSSSSSRCRENPPLSAADRMEHQRRKVRLLSMLDEVDGRYSQYCEQMQMVVTSFDLVMGFGSAVPYTALAQKAMSRHFRCLRDAVEMQLKHSCNLLREKDSMGTSGITRGETPRLKLLDQSFRRRRVLQDAGIMPEQEVWRPQRGLPERSVDILRAWLFENFLHPYPSEADKHLLARQTGLSKNQVANWFINARVRLWKPMVEEMYQQEAKDEEEGDRDYQRGRNPSSATNTAAIHSSQNPAATAKTTEIFAPESDPSIPSPISQDPSKAPPQSNSNGRHPSSSAAEVAKGRPIQPGLGLGRQLQKRRVEEDASCPSGGFSPDYGLAGDVDISSALIKLGASAGDVSLTLGLQHAGNFGLIN